MDQAGDTGFAGSLGDGAGAFDMKRVERLRSRACQHADGVDDAGRARQCADHGFGEAQIRLHRHDLADGTERLEVAGEIRAPDGRPDAPSSLRQRPHRMAPDEARTAEYRRQPIAVAHRCHPSPVMSREPG